MTGNDYIRDDLPCPGCGEVLVFSINSYRYHCAECGESYDLESVDPLKRSNFRARFSRYSGVMISSSPNAYFNTWSQLLALAGDLLAASGDLPHDSEALDEFELFQAFASQKHVLDIMRLGKVIESLKDELSCIEDLLIESQRFMPAQKRLEWASFVLAKSEAKYKHLVGLVPAQEKKKS